MPSLKPGETITWIKIEPPTLHLGRILASSFLLIGLVLGIALMAGIVMGHLKSKRPDPGGPGLGLRY